MEKDLLIKLVFILVAFLEAFGMGLLPVKVKSFGENPMLLGIANAFSGGVFIAIATMHIMPEETERYSNWYKKQ